MSLTASMWTSVSGLLAHGERMNTIGNNISNVNTVAFKGQRMDFQDFVYQSMGTAAGPGQVGRGTSIGAIMNDYSQGGMETTTNNMDMAIEGNGFFKVRSATNQGEYFTRAGNFRFNSDGYLTDPNGNILQGWRIPQENQKAFGNSNSGGVIGSGVPTDVQLDTFSCPPKHTSAAFLSLNLPSSAVASKDDKSTDAANPFFSMLKNWDATQTPALGDKNFSGQTTMTVYDEGGKSHKLTIYYDRVSNKNPSEVDGYTDSESYWEFLVTMDPSEDMRDFSSQYDPNVATQTTPDVPEKLKGLLGAGTLTFSSTGQVKDMSMFVPHTDGTAGDTWWKDDGKGGMEPDLEKWVAAPLDKDGLPVVAPNFSGAAGMSQAYQNGVWSQPNANAEGRLISLDFGLSSKNHNWNFTADPDGNTPGTYVDTAGNATSLVTAAGLSRTYDTQKTDAKGRYEWESTVTDPVTGLAYKVHTKNKTDTPSGVWGSSPSGNNASEFYWDVSVPGGSLTNGGTLPVRITTGKDGSPTVNFAAAKNRDDSTLREYTTTGGYKLSIGRSNTSDPYLMPADITGTWTLDTTSVPGKDLWVNSSNSQIKLETAPGALTTPAAVANAVKSQTFTESSNNASNYYWVGTVAGEKGVEIQITTGSNTAPTATSATQGNNATEYYWTDATNPDIQATTGATPPNLTPPGAPTGTWSPVMETVTRSNKYFIAGLGGQGQVGEGAITNYGTSYYENNVTQDGYTYGDLKDVYVSANGVITGKYTNGESLQLYQVVLYDFASEQNLYREGGNLFSETRESGQAASGPAGTARFGNVRGSTLEQSNVDLAREFVNMITTQRGFQANSKSITTVDTMLETVIGMKR